MGRKNRERIERIKAGLEQPIARKAVALASHNRVVSELRAASTEDQIHVLDNRVGEKEPGKLKKALMDKAPGEMDKGIKRLQKEGKPVTVDALCAEVTSTPGFLSMCEKVGLTLTWFENLAQQRMAAHGLNQEAQ